MAVAAVMAGRGVTTILPDHLGLKGSYTANRLGAHITLDAMRAARQIKQAMVRDSKMIIAGYSGGAMVAGFSAAMQPAYAPELNVVGAVMGGIPVNMEWMGKTLGNARNPAFGIVMASMLGLEREYPNRMIVTPRLSKKGKKLANRNRNACITRILDQWANESATTTMNNVQIRQQYREMKVLRENSIINYPRAPKVPVYVGPPTKTFLSPTGRFRVSSASGARLTEVCAPPTWTPRGPTTCRTSASACPWRSPGFLLALMACQHPTICASSATHCSKPMRCSRC